MTSVQLLIAAVVVLVVAFGILSLTGHIRYWRFKVLQRKRER